MWNYSDFPLQKTAKMNESIPGKALAIQTKFRSPRAAKKLHHSQSCKDLRYSTPMMGEFSPRWGKVIGVMEEFMYHGTRR
jgi:hypothetical protein